MSRSSTSSQPRLELEITLPAPETTPGTATPMPTSPEPASRIIWPTSESTSSRSTRSPSSSTRSRRSTILARRSITAPVITYGRDRSMHIRRSTSVSMASKVPGLPRPSRFPDPSSRSRPSSIISPVTSVAVARESPVSLHRSARDSCRSGNSSRNNSLRLLALASLGLDLAYMRALLG